MDNVDIDVHGYEAAPKIITGDLLKALRVDETEVEDSDVDDPYNPANESTVLNRLPDEVFAAIAKFMDPTSYFNTKAICQVLKWKCERVERDLIFPIHSVILKKDGALEVICVEAKDEKIYDKLPGTRFGLTIDSFNCESGPLDDKLLDKVEALLHRRRVTIDALTTLKITCSLEKFKTFSQKHAIKRFRLGGEVPETFLDFMQDKIACMCGEDDFSQKLPGGMDYFLKSPITCGDFTFPPQKPFTVDNCRQLIEALNAGRILGHIFFSVHNISNYDDIFTGMVTLNFDKDRDYGKELAEITTRPLVFRSSVDFVSVVATEGDKMYLLDGEFDNKFFVLLSYNVDDIRNFYGFDQDYADTELNENEDLDEDDEEYEDAEDSEND